MSLHGLRGFSAMCVVLFHLGFYMGVISNPFGQMSATASSLYALQYAVELFFMISGFLITATLIQHGSVGHFAWNRFLRIYPVFFLLHLVFFTVGASIQKEGMFTGITPDRWIYLFITNGLMLPGVFPIPAAQEVAWTLSFELAFYVCAALIYLMYRRHGSRIATACAILATVGFWLIQPRSIYFAVGVVVYLLGQHAALKRLSFGSVAAITAGICFFVIVQSPSHFGGQRWTELLALPFAGTLFIAVVYQKNALNYLLEMPPMQYLGTISYSLYMWHTLVLSVFKKIGAHWPGVPTAFIMLASVCASVAVAHVSYVLIEQHLTARLRRLITTKRLQTTSSVPAE